MKAGEGGHVGEGVKTAGMKDGNRTSKADSAYTRQLLFPFCTWL